MRRRYYDATVTAIDTAIFSLLIRFDMMLRRRKIRRYDIRY